MKYRPVYVWILLMLLVLLISGFSGQMYEYAAAMQISSLTLQSDSFRSMTVEESYLNILHQFCEKTDAKPSEFLTPAMAAGRFRIPEEVKQYTADGWERLHCLFLKYNRNGYEKLEAAYQAVWDDVKQFPVPEPGIVFENSWMFERTYGGLRGHEGTDLIPPLNLPGYYPIRSMTDGVVEKTGWLEKGGYRIGIRSPSGGYFYYAHLDSYAEVFSPGDLVYAGDVLGFMGDTGYGPEGTRGCFPVHLHLGIYIYTENRQEISINPYWVLRYLKD
ncbi:MAG: M23 family metallopeptidase [Lachnospiraceae bacterium]|nr:M23 family metallopeptidase [Lachnospiraceae bacterium]